MPRVLFPHLDGLAIGADRAVGPTVHTEAATRDESAGCPCCSTPSRRVHSRYRRRLSDTSITGREVVIVLRVQRLKNQNSNRGVSVGLTLTNPNHLTAEGPQRRIKPVSARQVTSKA
ncbi:transposase family protein [Nocardia sp. GAS34]|uniref:transposase family protein n=1 Tax=unclassified Nocardia TaxID=2637762 RepID=UPI003D225001